MNRPTFCKRHIPQFNQGIERGHPGAFPITLASIGEKVRVASLAGGRTMCQKLIGMGINVGSELRVIKKGPPGPCLVAVDTARLAIGAGMAQRIMVKPIE